jgi:hypothetical protein
MSYSLVNVNMALSIQDQLAVTGATAQSFVNRIVPQLQFASLNVAQYTGYYTLTSNAPIALTPTATPIFVMYFRLASGSAFKVNYAPSGGSPTTIQISPGSIFFYGNTGLDQSISNNFVQNVNVFGANSGQISVFEYLLAY